MRDLMYAEQGTVRSVVTDAAIAEKLFGATPQGARLVTCVRLLEETPENARRWDDYVARAEHATSDHRWGWRAVLSRAFGFTPYYLAVFEYDRVVGVLPLFKVPRGLRGCALSSIPYGNYGGLCADFEDAAQALLEEGKTLMRQLGAEYLELRHRRIFLDDSLQLRASHTRFSLPLTGDVQHHFAQFGTKNRNKVKRALRDGLTTVSSRDLTALYDIHTQTTRRLGTPCFPKRYFALIMQSFGETAEVRYVLFEGRPIAYSLLIRFKWSLVCQFSGSMEAFRNFKPNNLLVWDAIERGCKSGMTEFDYCRSRVGSGTAAFKRELRLDEELLHYQYCSLNGLMAPQHSPSNPKYRRLVRAWQRLPLFVTRRLGPRVVRYFA